MHAFVSWFAAGLLMLFAASCGEVKSGNLADAPPPVDAPPLPVKVTVLTNTGDGLPDPTAKVVFQDPSATLVLDGTVDAMGHIEALMPSGGAVTVIRITSDTPTALSAAVTTTTGVKPGDELVFGLKPPGTITNQGGETTMTATFTPNPDAERFTFYTACGMSSALTGATSVALTFRDSCHGDTFDLIGVASGSKLIPPLFLKATNVRYANGETVNIPGSFTRMSTFMVNMANIPDAVSSLIVQRSSLIGSTAVAHDSSVAVDPPAGAYSVTVNAPQSFGTRSQIALTLRRADSNVAQVHEVRTATLSQPVAINLGTLQLPWITDFLMTSTGATWTMVAPGDAPDGMVTSWGGRWSDGTRTTTVGWRIAQPFEAAGMTLPKLPAAYAMFDPGQQAVAATPIIALMAMVDYDGVVGYDEFRRMPETLTSSIASLGAFVDMPFERRMATAVTRLGAVGGALPAGFAAPAE